MNGFLSGHSLTNLNKSRVKIGRRYALSILNSGNPNVENFHFFNQRRFKRTLFLVCNMVNQLPIIIVNGKQSTIQNGHFIFFALKIIFCWENSPQKLDYFWNFPKLQTTHLPCLLFGYLILTFSLIDFFNWSPIQKDKNRDTENPRRGGMDALGTIPKKSFIHFGNSPGLSSLLCWYKVWKRR